MAFTRIVKNDTANKGVVGLPDTPGLSATEMQKKFDELALDVIVPKHNNLIAELEATTGAASLGATVPSGISASPNVQAILNAIGSGQSALNQPSGATKVGATNPVDNTTTTVQGALNSAYAREQSDIASVINRQNSDVASLNKQISDVDAKTTNNINKISSDVAKFKNNLMQPTGAKNIGATVPKGIVSSADNVQDVIDEVYRACRTGGDMQKSVYDKQNRGYVDHAETADKINNIEGTEIQLKTDQRLETTSKSVVGAINELKRSADIFDSTAMFYIDEKGHYCVDTLQAEEIIEFRIDENSRLNITVNV